jgi:excinuclease UvrABC nuclease subunit
LRSRRSPDHLSEFKELLFAQASFNFAGNWNEVGGVYGITNASGQVIYVGSTDNFRRRMSEHQNDRSHLMHRYGPAYAYAEVIHTEAERLRRERALISEYNPHCNQKVA